MKSPEYIVHGTSSEKDAENIEAEGFKVLEGRATVSGDLIYAFDWATDQARRRGSKSETMIDDGESGRMIVMSVPEDKSVDYATHTGVAVDDGTKEVSGYSSKYVSGRRQLAIYEGSSEGTHEEATSISEGKPAIVKISREHILLSVVPTSELGQKLNELNIEIRKLDRVDLETFVIEITRLIESNKENFIAPGLVLREVIGNLLVSTIETEVVNMVRALSLDVKRALGYKVFNRGKYEKKDKDVDMVALKNKLERMVAMTEIETFDIGLESLNRYMKVNFKKLLTQLDT